MSVSPIFANSYYSKLQLEQARQNDGQARSSSDSLALNAEMQDTVKFSENALKKLQETAEDMNGQNKDPFAALYKGDEGDEAAKEGSSQPSRVQHVEVKDPETGRDVSSATKQQTIDSIRKQIAEVKKQLQKAQERLQEMQMRLEEAKGQSKPQAGGDSPEAAAKRLQAEGEAGGSDSPELDISGMEAAAEQMINVSIIQTEMQSVSQEIKTLNGQLMSLNNKLVEAMEEAYGTGNGPPGAAGGTRAGGGMGSSAGGAGFKGINIGV